MTRFPSKVLDAILPTDSVLKAAINAEVYVAGVDPTGAADSTLALQAAIDAKAAAGGGVVRAPFGNYLTSGTLQMRSKVDVEFGGRWSVAGALGTQQATYVGSTIKLAAGSNCDMVQFGPTVTSARLAGVALLGNGTNQTAGKGVRFVGSASQPRSGNWLDRVYVTLTHDEGVVVDVNHREARMREVLVLGCGDNGVHVSGNDCFLDLIVTGYNTGHGLLLDGNSQSSTARAIDAFNNTLTGITVSNTSLIRAASWQANNNGREGIVLDTSSHTAIVGGVLLDNGQEFSTSGVRYADVRVTHATGSNVGLALMGLSFTSTAGVQSYALLDNSFTVVPQTVVGCSFTGAYASGYVSPARTYQAFGNYNLTNTIRPVDTASTALVTKGFAGQSVDLQQWQNSAGAITGRVNSAGRLDGVVSTYPRSGTYLAPAALTSTGTIANQYEYAVPLVVGGPCTLNEVGIEVTTIGDTGSTIRLGIRADDGTGYPSSSAPLVDAGAVAGDSTGYKGLTISVAVASPRLLWLTATVQGAATTPPTVRTVNGQLPQVSTTTGAGATSGARSAYRQAGVSGALPSTFSATNDAQGGGPRLVAKVA